MTLANRLLTRLKESAGTLNLFVSSFVSTNSRSHVLQADIRCPAGACKALKTWRKRHKILQMRLDTYGFVISRSPVRSRRVAPETT